MTGARGAPRCDHGPTAWGAGPRGGRVGPANSSGHVDAALTSAPTVPRLPGAGIARAGCGRGRSTTSESDGADPTSRSTPPGMTPRRSRWVSFSVVWPIAALRPVVTDQLLNALTERVNWITPPVRITHPVASERVHESGGTPVRVLTVRALGTQTSCVCRDASAWGHVCARGLPSSPRPPWGRQVAVPMTRPQGPSAAFAWRLCRQRPPP